MNTHIKNFESIAHTADLKIRVYGTTIQQLFRHAVSAMFQTIKPKPALAGCREIDSLLVCDTLPIHRPLTVTAPDIESLLVDFLSEVLYLSDRYNEAYLDATIEQLTTNVSKCSLHALLHGIPIHGFEIVEIKAVTYHELAIKKIDNTWQTDIVFDI